ncbi:AAA family ATPase [Pleionea sp. CnH1-48]|uniref:AAA family ATPase n=1 Tax=Pleionea sp. CnH1-48 TaxID=2954494 RepID=UPI002097BC5E|nr:AAA family ATPase [Pleionea sp. CnH1-48]MCO7225998.1 ATP-binding protein [Pleionea sp. CnH1-48]
MAKIKKFLISGLFSERDVEIEFDSNVKIMVAENGQGKTTILNALYGVLSGDLFRLENIEFSSMRVCFDDGDEFKIDKEEIDFYPKLIGKNKYLLKNIEMTLGRRALGELLKEYHSSTEEEFRKSEVLKYASNKMEVSPVYINHMLRESEGDKDLSMFTKVRDVLDKIQSKLNYKVVYLPTYRRVEQDFKELGLEAESLGEINSEFINFGMRDIDSKIKEITKEILESSVEWFSKVNGEMLSQLIEGFNVNDELRESIKNPDAIKIVLDRVGSNIDEHYKERIINLIDSGEIFTGHDPLIYFIANLSKVYEQQKDNDICMQNFTNVCNRYLGDKKIEYNESMVTMDIVRRKNNKSVGIETLSSGEKQIISLFAKLYLQKNDNLALFFDEPELSLSMEWQKTLLPDIVNSSKCEFLFCATHSPFIFENELVEHTVDLASSIREL